jgi:tRNA pseudouridine55 synthase
MFGLLNLHKPAGLSSRAVVNAVDCLLPDGLKVGHAGTLDPMATGVLVLCVGQATRLVPYVQELKKSYRAGFRLGCRSDTDDVTGTVIDVPGAVPPSRDEIEAALAAFRGVILQTPPQYSALRVRGKRAYEMARAGKAVELAPREVEVTRLELLRADSFDLEVEIDCSSGTYIRSIARDLGESLGSGGLMTRLVRTAIGPFTLETAISPDSLSCDTIAAALLHPALAIGDLPTLTVTSEQAAAIRQGKKLILPSSIRSHSTVATVDPQGELIAFGEYDANEARYHPRNVFLEEPAT